MKLKIKNALISVSDKEDIVPLLKVLKKNNIKIISSGGTYKILKKLGYECTELSKYTGFKEMLDGRLDIRTGVDKSKYSTFVESGNMLRLDWMFTDVNPVANGIEQWLS